MLRMLLKKDPAHTATNPTAWFPPCFSLSVDPASNELRDPWFRDQILRNWHLPVPIHSGRTPPRRIAYPGRCQKTARYDSGHIRWHLTFPGFHVFQIPGPLKFRPAEKDVFQNRPPRDLQNAD